MNLLKNIKLNYTSSFLNQSIDKNDFSDFKKNYESLRKIDQNVANKYIRFNSLNFIENEELNFLFNKNIIWSNSFRKKDTELVNKFISQILELTSDIKFKHINFYEEVLKLLNNEEIKDYQFFNDIFLKSHYYFQMIIDNHNPGVKLMNTNSAFFEYDKKVHFTHPKLTKCFFYILKHPYQIFSELKQEGLTSQAALTLLCNLENKSAMIEIKKNGNTLSCPENSNSWENNVLSWTNDNVQSSLRGITFLYDDLLSNTEDILMMIAGHLKESGFAIEINPLEISNLADKFTFDARDNPSIEISNKEKKIIDRDCGSLIEKFFSEKKTNY
jgi:hypothetical protein